MSSHHHSSSHHSSVSSVSHVAAHSSPATSHVSARDHQPAVGKPDASGHDKTAQDAGNPTKTKDHTTLSDEAQAEQKPTQDGSTTQPKQGDPNANGQTNPNDPNANGQTNPNDPNANGQTNPNDPNAPNPNDPTAQAIQGLTAQLQQMQAELAALQNQQAQNAGQGSGQQGGGGSDGGGGQQGGGQQGGAQPTPSANPAGMNGMQPGMGGQDPNTILMADVMQVQQASAAGPNGKLQKQTAIFKLQTDYQQAKASGAMVNPQVDQMVQQVLGSAAAGFAAGGFGGFPGGTQMGGIGIPQMGGAFSLNRW